MKTFTINNQKAGFAPIIIIAIIAVLAVGGGAYAVSKNKEKKEMELQTNMNAEVKAEAEVNTNVKGSIRSLLAIGKNTMCTFTSTAGGVTSSGTTYIGANGDMSGDFSSTTSSGTVASHMVMKDGMSYSWSGNQGVKMNVAEMNANSSTSTSNNQSVNLDSQVDYKCENWVRDESKFTLPSTVTFMDLNTMMKLQPGSNPYNVDVNAMMKLKAQ